MAEGSVLYDPSRGTFAERTRERFDGDPFAAIDAVASAPGNVARAVIDVPADALNAATGTGENLGIFGKIDRGLDPRDPEEWADPSNPEAQGLSGALRAAGGATGATLGIAGGSAIAGGAEGLGATAQGAAEGIGSGLSNLGSGIVRGLTGSPVGFLVLVVGLIVALGTLFDVDLGGRTDG